MRSSFLIALLALSLFAGMSVQAQAPKANVTGIVVFDGPSGPTSVQVTGLMVNTKTELRVCDGVSKINKNVYDTLPRIQLAGSASLERRADGSLTLTNSGKPFCVVPNNLRFQGNAELTLAEAADQAILQGTPVGSSVPGTLPALKPGVAVVLAPVPDDDLADYLVAERVNNLKGWQDFLARHAGSSRAANARNAIAAIIEDSADATFARYQKTAAANAPDIALLKQAAQQAEQANKTSPGYGPANRLKEQINKEIDSLLEADRANVQAYKKALADNTPGASHLSAARQHTEQILSINPDYAPAINLHREVGNEVRKLETALQNAEGLVTAGRYDEALDALGPYKNFASEMPRIESIVAGAYSSHLTKGQELAGKQDWEHAVAEFRSALAIKSDSQEAASALKNAQAQLAAANNQRAAERAIQQSKSYAADNQFIEAYDVLDELPDEQRALVSAQMLALKKDYVPAAMKRAQKLQEVHLPIRGRADEDAVREAHDLLSHASSLSGDPAVKLKMDLLSDKLSAYYLDQARRYLEKPLGSGVGVGWLYLAEADRFRPNTDAVRDAMARYTPAYQLRSRLSIGVVLRDQTSRRESLGFADQLVDAIANGLEASRLSVKVVRQPKEGADVVPPNFLLIGEILQHRVVRDVNLETLPSKYRTGTREVKSDAWLQASHDNEAAQQQLTTAQHALADAQAQHKKKDVIAAANDAVTAAQKLVDETKRKLDAAPQTQIQSVVATYNYNKKNIDLNAVVELAFRITDSAGNVVEPTVSIPKNNRKTVVVLENVKPEDTEGVKAQGTEPDDVQFLTDLEIQARDTLVKAAREKVLMLPQKVLQDARARAQQGDVDGAAEKYVLYLNAVSDSGSPERDEGAKFLHDHYNVAITPAARPVSQSQAKTQ